MSRVRIIGGTWRSRLIEVPNSVGLRPTPNAMRERLFNWLGQDLTDLTCLDLFAGTGVLGLEAASRGAKSVTFVERAPRVFAALKRTVATLGAQNVELVCADACAFLSKLQPSGKQFDGIFLDPPYHQDWLKKIEPYFPAVLAPGGWVYVEAECALKTWGHLQIDRTCQLGQVHAHLLKGGSA